MSRDFGSIGGWVGVGGGGALAALNTEATDVSGEVWGDGWGGSGFEPASGSSP